MSRFINGNILQILLIIFLNYSPPVGFCSTNLQISSVEQIVQVSQDKPLQAHKMLVEALSSCSADSMRAMLGKTAFNLGNNFYLACDYKFAEPFLVTSASIFKQINDTVSYGWALQRLALTQKYWGHYRDGLKSVQEAIKVFESVNNLVGISYAQMVEVYINNAWGHFDKAEGSCREALSRHKKLGQKGGEAYCLLALGNFHLESNRPDSAWIYFEQAQNIFTNIGSDDGLALCKRDKGKYWLKQNDFSKAIEFFYQSLAIHSKLKFRRGISEVESLIGLAYLKQQNYKSAIKHLEKGLKISNEIEVVEEVVKNHRLLALAYEKIGNHTKANKNLNSFIEVNDSLFNAEKHFQLMDLHTQYQTEKKIQQIELQNAQIEKNNIEISRKNLFIIFLATGLILLFALSFVVYQLYQTKKKDNELLSKQKRMIEQKNRQITDSINYASRIQHAVLSTEDDLKKLFQESFILYMPKDIVSGDFYYFKNINSKLLVSAADCTGHGVPGAFMSMLGTTLLNEITTNFSEGTAASILETLRQKAKDALHQSSFKSETKDGMEMALCLIDKSSNVLQFAGAGSPLFHIRKGILTHYKGVSCPIGVYIKEHPFQDINIQVQTGDCIYIFSDGFADQIGGSNSQKLKLKSFKQLLIDNAELPLDEQKNNLGKFITNYMKGHDQIDDIMVIGFRI